MTKDRLQAFLDENPEAAKHENSIRGALGDLADLRKNGFPSKSYNLVPPFGGKISTPTAKKDKFPTRTRFKLTDKA